MDKYIQQNDKIIKSLADSIDRLSMETINYFRSIDGTPKILWNSLTDKTKFDNSKINVIEISRVSIKGELEIMVAFSVSKYTFESLPYYVKGLVSRLLIEKYL